MDNAWVAKWSIIGTMIAASLAGVYGLLTMPRVEPEECTILPFPLVVSQE